MRVQVKITELPANHSAFLRVEDANTAEQVQPDLPMRNEEALAVDVPDGADVRVFAEVDASHAALNDHMRTGA